MMTKLAISAILLFASLPALASNWVPLATGANSTIAIDTESIAKKGQIVTVWEQVTYTTPEPSSTIGGKPIAVVKVRVAFNCVEKTSAIFSWGRFAADLSIVESGHGDAKYDDVMPDSVGDTVMKSVCK